MLVPMVAQGGRCGRGVQRLCGLSGAFARWRGSVCFSLVQRISVLSENGEFVVAQP